MISYHRLNSYRIMWVLVLFDLPTQTKKDRSSYTVFRKELLKDGFNMFQFSVYARHCGSRERAQVHIRRVKKLLPSRGQIGIMTITDKQMSDMQVFYGLKQADNPASRAQLTMF